MRVTIRPFFGKPEVEANIFIATVALSSMIAQAILLIYSGRDKNLAPAIAGNMNLGILSTTNHQLFILLVAPIVLFAMWLVLNKTTIGRAIRAVSQDPMGAVLIGISTKKIYGITVGVATVLAGISGVLLGPIYFLNPHMGESPLTKAFIIVILGGIGSLKGTIVAAFIVALLEVLVGLFVGVTWGPLGLFAVLILILLFRPEGLFGAKKRLMIAIALATKPQILILDEPCAGLTAIESKEIIAFIGQLGRHFGSSRGTRQGGCGGTGAEHRDQRRPEIDQPG